MQTALFGAEVDMNVERANIEDAGAILEMQKQAFRSEAAIYDDFDVPPLTETLECIKAEFGKKVFLKVQFQGRIIGAVRGFQLGRTCYVERLAVHPDFQNRGIGTALMFEMERVFPQVERFELFTGQRSEKNLCLYQRLGYREFKRQRLTDKVTAVFMAKVFSLP